MKKFIVVFLLFPSLLFGYTRVVNETGTDLDVMLQDQTSEVIDLYAIDLENAITPTLTQGQDIGDKSITVDDATGILDTGVHAINISEDGRLFQAVVTDVTGLVVSFNAPLDIDITTSAVVKIAPWNMAVDGSSTPRYFAVSPPEGVTWDITRFIVGMTGTATMDDSKFGSLASLSNGVVLQIINGTTKNLMVVNDNGGFAERAYDATYPTKVPAGVYAFRVRKTYGGQDKMGVVIRLNGDDGDELRWLIQDDLLDATFTKFACTFQGHVVVD